MILKPERERAHMDSIYRKFSTVLPDRDMQVVCRGEFDIIGNYGIGLKCDNCDIARFWYNLKGRNPLTERLDKLFNCTDEREYGRCLNIPLYEIYEDALRDMNKMIGYLNEVVNEPTEWNLAKSHVKNHKNWEEYFAYLCVGALGNYSDFRLGAGFDYINGTEFNYDGILIAAQYINRQ